MGTEILVEKQRWHEPGLCGGVGHQPTLAIRRKRQHRANVVALEVWKVGEDLLFSHPAGEKLYQEVFFGHEAVEPTAHPKVLRSPADSESNALSRPAMIR